MKIFLLITLTTLVILLLVIFLNSATYNGSNSPKKILINEKK
jgi:hypothetical protein